MNKRFILKSIISLYQSFNTFSPISFNNNEKISFSTMNNSINNWFEMSYFNIYNLAIMSHNVYYDDNNKWYNSTFNYTNDISKDNDTVRAYLFSSEDLKTHIISMKGTSTYFGKNNYIQLYNSIYNDKFNDNLFYSCCFYEQSNMFNKIDELNNEKCWSTDTQNQKKDQIILKSEKICKPKCFKALNEYKLNYITISKQIIENIKQIINFENNEILFTGHSLGGSLATTMGLIYNKPAISFQSPGIKNFLYQSGILNKVNLNNLENIYNFGHNADIIFTGKCNGKLSLCYLGGYNIETKCHIGKVCEYDAINKLNISESIFTHKLKYVIEKIIPNWKNDFPECKFNNNCTDCEKWSYTNN